MKFWKKKEDEGIEFVKHFRSHLGECERSSVSSTVPMSVPSVVFNVCVCVCLGVIECISVSAEGALLCTVGDDQAMKVFDVVNFDMINMLKLG